MFMAIINVMRFETNQLYRHSYGREFIELKEDSDFLSFIRKDSDLFSSIDRLNKINITPRKRIKEILLGGRYNVYSRVE